MTDFPMPRLITVPATLCLPVPFSEAIDTKLLSHDIPVNSGYIDDEVPLQVNYRLLWLIIDSD